MFGIGAFELKKILNRFLYGTVNCLGKKNENFLEGNSPSLTLYQDWMTGYSDSPK